MVNIELVLVNEKKFNLEVIIDFEVLDYSVLKGINYWGSYYLFYVILFNFNL